MAEKAKGTWPPQPRPGAALFSDAPKVVENRVKWSRHTLEYFLPVDLKYKLMEAREHLRPQGDLACCSNYRRYFKTNCEDKTNQIDVLNLFSLMRSEIDSRCYTETRRIFPATSWPLFFSHTKTNPAETRVPDTKRRRYLLGPQKTYCVGAQTRDTKKGNASTRSRLDD